MIKLTTQISFGTRTNPVEVLLFTRHLSTMIKAGIPIAEALTTLSDQTKSASFRIVIDSVSASVQNGQSLATALRKHPRVFDQFYINLIAVSEESGTLEENLIFIANELAKNYSLKKKINAAALYPALVFMAVTIMGGFISFFVLPQLVDFFEALSVELPLSTQILLFIATAFKNHGLLIAGCVIGLVVSIRLLVKTSMVKPTWDAFLLKVPIVGKFVAASQLAQFTRNLGVLIKSGVPIAKSIEITAGTLSNLEFRHDLLKIGKALTEGQNIADAIEKGHYTQFPPIVSKMIGVGEKTGKLDESLLYLGDFYEEEVDTFSKNLTTILEPLLLMGIGLVVGFVALAIITPIYELSGSIRN